MWPVSGAAGGPCHLVAIFLGTSRLAACRHAGTAGVSGRAAGSVHGGGGDASNAGLLLLAFLLVETYDSYALLGGKLFGRRPAFPVLSPKKTVEGLAVGGAMMALTAGLVGPLVFGWSLAASLLAAALIAVAAVGGDLAGSRLKRASGVKDYPAVLPRQGGALDIADAWLIAGPALVLLAAVAG
ncbi:MAG: phosphatidate cytidylyltransferase [Alphaproteobacteria bacterium]|nr:phosphatidate cytidylyltransferase [Alphaproteobacteria bacterium]